MRQGFRITIILGLLAALSAGPAVGQIDPDPDGIGIYADFGATQPSIQVDPVEEFTLHLIATNLGEADVVTWALKVTPSPGLYILGYEIPYDYQSHFYQVDGGAYHFIVSGDLGDPSADPPEPPVPIGYGPNMRLLDITFLIGELGPHYLFIGPNEVLGSGPDPVYSSSRTLIEGPGLIPLYPSSGSNDAPVFVVNGQDPIANEILTFGAVKALFR